jgi:hypothetical protein
MWRYMFRSLVRFSAQGGSGPCVYAVSCIGASRMHGKDNSKTFAIEVILIRRKYVYKVMNLNELWL